MTTKPSSTPDREAVVLKAIRWLIELDADDRKDGKLWRRFERWLNAQPSHREVFKQVSLASRVVAHLAGHKPPPRRKK